MPEPLDYNDEQTLLKIVKEASMSACDKADPNEAITKIAREHKLTPGRIRLVCNAFNTGTQLSQKEASSNVFDKLASFPLADADKVISNIYTPEEKKAEDISAEDFGPPTWYYEATKPKQTFPHLEKAAAAIKEREVGPLVAAERKYTDLKNVFEKASKHRDQVRTKKAALQDKFRRAMSEAVDYFRTKFARDRYSFAEVEYVTRTYFPKRAELLLDFMHQSLPNEKRAAADEGFVFSSPIRFDENPFLAIKKCVKIADEICDAETEEEDAEEELKEAKAAFLGVIPRKEANKSNGIPIGVFAEFQSKEASIFGLPPTLIGGLAGYGTSALSRKPKEKLVEKAVYDISAPEHLNELRKIQVNTMLNSMLTDPEDPISSYDPEDVLAAYNEISAMAPRLATQPMALKPLLRKRLAGNMEPFETKEVVDMESKMKLLAASPQTMNTYQPAQ